MACKMLTPRVTDQQLGMVHAACRDLQCSQNAFMVAAFRVVLQDMARGGNQLRIALDRSHLHEPFPTVGELVEQQSLWEGLPVVLPDRQCFHQRWHASQRRRDAGVVNIVCDECGAQGVYVDGECSWAVEAPASVAE